MGNYTTYYIYDVGMPVRVKNAVVRRETLAGHVLLGDSSEEADIVYTYLSAEQMTSMDKIARQVGFASAYGSVEKCVIVVAETEPSSEQYQRILATEMVQEILLAQKLK